MILFLTIIVNKCQGKNSSVKNHDINTFMKRETAIDGFGKRLAYFRKAKGLSQKGLGDHIGVSNRVISYYERESKHPPAHLIAPLAKILGISTDELLGLNNDNMDFDTRNAALWRKLKLVESLPQTDQRAILHYIKMIAKNRGPDQNTSKI